MSRIGPVLLCLIAAWMLGLWAWSLASQNGVTYLPLDDAYIHLQYARTAAGGEPFAYQPGEPVSTGATSPLWVLLLSVVALFGKSLVVLPVAALLFNTLAAALCFYAASRLAHRHGVPPALAWLPAVCGVFTLTWLFGMWNGMETGLYAAALLGAAWVLAGGALGWLVPLALVRPEGAVIALGVLVWRLRARRAASRDVSRASAKSETNDDTQVFFSSLAVLLTAGLMLALPHLLTGTMSSGLLAKATIFEPKPETRAFYLDRLFYFALRGLWFGLSGLRHQPPLDILAPLTRPDAWPTYLWAAFLGGGTVLAFVRRAGRGPLVLWALTSAAAVGAIAWDAQGYRYLVPSFGLLAVGASVGWLSAGRLKHLRRACGAILFLGAALGTVLGPGRLVERFALTYRGECERLGLAQIAAGEWIHANLPEGTRVATHDVGAIAFYGQRPVVDLVGLVTPQMAGAYRHGEGTLWEALDRLPDSQRPSWALVIPAWMPYLAHTFIFEKAVWNAGDGVVNARSQQFAAFQIAWPADDGPRWPNGDFGNVPALHGAAMGRPEYRVIDAVDLADLESESAHNYGQPNPAPETIIRDLGFPPGYGPGPGTHVIEGGRDIDGAFFTMQADTSHNARLVLRTASARAERLTVRIGTWSGILSVPADETRYAEPSMAVPQSVLRNAQDTSGNIRIDLEGQARIFHAWLLRDR